MSSGISTTCLSAASILRCPSLTRFQYAILLIPTVLEAIFVSSLAVMVWKAGQKRHLLLTSEGWAHLILGVVDLLSHVLTPARTDVAVFSAFDIGLGVASFIPLFFFTFYLYIYTNSDLLVSTQSLPKLLSRIARLLLLFCIPAIIITNEVGSHVGIRRIMFQGQILIGFPSRGLFTINAFFSALTLALLVVFQAVVFLIAFFRLFAAVLNQRKFQNKGKDAYHLVKGIAWLSTGLKIGAIETLVGFMGASFEILLTRKILHLLSRIFLCIGIIKGVDYIEDFNVVRKEIQEATRSKLTLSPFEVQSNPTPAPAKPSGIRGKISNPRMSTFQQLSPTAKEFYQLPRAHLYKDSAFDWNKDAKSPNSAGEFADRGMGGIHVSQVDTNGKEVVPRLRSLGELQGIEAFSNLKEQVKAQREASEEYDDEKAERVTIGRRESNGAPTLLLKRFSSALFPSPTDVIASIRKSLFRNSKMGSISESDSERGRQSQYPATILEGYAEKGYGDSYTIPTLSKDRSKRNSTTSSFEDKDHDPVSLLRPNVSQIPARASPFPVQSIRSPGPGHYIRNSVFRASQGSFASGISDLEIVSAPRRTLSGKKAEATFYSVANTQFDTTSQFSTPKDGGIAPPPQAMFTNQLAESPESYGPLSSDSQQTGSNHFRIVSDYSQFRDSMTTDYRASASSQVLQSQEVRQLTRQFPGPPLMFNGRPVMGGLEQRKIYEDDSSGPESPMTALRPPTTRRVSGLRHEVDLGQAKNRISVQSDLSEQSGLTIASGFEGVLPPAPTIPPPTAPAPSTARRTSFGRETIGNLLYNGNQRDSNTSSRYSFDVDLESGKRASFAADMEDAPRIVVVRDIEDGQRSPAATDGHGGSTPKGNALGLLRPMPSTNTLGGSLRPQPSMASMASNTTEASLDPFRDDQASPASTTFAVDNHSHGSSRSHLPASATGSAMTSRSVTPIATLTVPSHNVSAPTSPGDDDVGHMNRFSISPMSIIDNLPTAAIVDSVNDSQFGGGRGRKAPDGWPAFASPDSAHTEFPAQPFRLPAARRGRPVSQMMKWSGNNAAAPPSQALPQVPRSQPPTRPPTPPHPSSRSRSSSRTRSKSRSSRGDDDESERRRRQRSMDAAARDVSASIPWLSTPRRAEDKKLQKVLSSKALINSPVSPLNPQRPSSKMYSGARRSSKGSFRGSPKSQLVPLQVSRIKTIGNVKQRTTPRPVRNHPGMARGSVYIQPIMIPRQSVSFSGMYVVNEDSAISNSPAETILSESPVDLVVRRDSDVFGTTLGGEMKR
ncbi:hypothetical protein BKA70DRAFT_1560504 [Coprinopsis sp. MPI-PUGE-AT-0042]|nr:hypothetical protein BKA70DRAFT_1560504 [Coprinopsis sp. MPI-PUGE-AT-0042]